MKNNLIYFDFKLANLMISPFTTRDMYFVK